MAWHSLGLIATNAVVSTEPINSRMVANPEVGNSGPDCCSVPDN